MRSITSRSSLMAALLSASIAWAGEAPRALPTGQQPNDIRLGPLRTLNDSFPFSSVDSPGAWKQRVAELRQQVLVANGLWPLPTRTPLNAVIHGRIERDDYTVEKVYFESFPGHFVTGNLYRPRGYSGPRPAILCPHGHWPNGRFHDHGEAGVRAQIAMGAERFETSGRYPLQARAVQLARMGCIVFFYDMVGYADSVQIPHHPHLQAYQNGEPPAEGFATPAAELRLANIMGLQTWNSVRALDFVLGLTDVDHERIGVTGASGGGTQTFMLAAVDDRVKLAVPAVMVSTAMQGGCTCENAPYLRLGAGNIDLAALAAPRPLGLIAANDWTKEMTTKGFPDLKNLYTMLGEPDRVALGAFVHFPHNYNAVSRGWMYSFVNQHFALGHKDPVIERDFVPLSRDEMSVWDASHPAPVGEQAGAAHEKKLLEWWASDSESQLRESKETLAAGWRILIGRRLEDVGSVEYDQPYQKLDRGSYLLMTAVLGVPRHHEQVPVMFLYPKEGWNRRVVIVVTDTGKAGLLDKTGEPAAEFAELLKRGFAVAGLDMIGQGEFSEDGQPWASARGYPPESRRGGTWSWQHPGLYVYGYNRPLFCQRVHDVLTMIRFVQTDQHTAQKIDLVGVGTMAGPIAAAAKFMAGDAVASAVLEEPKSGMTFASLDRFDHPMFVPGAVRYGDVDALKALAAGDGLPAAERASRWIDRLSP